MKSHILQRRAMSKGASTCRELLIKGLVYRMESDRMEHMMDDTPVLAIGLVEFTRGR